LVSTASAASAAWPSARSRKDFPNIEVVGINDLLDPDYLAYMLKYDSVHGNFQGDIAVDGNTMIVNGKTIRLTAERTRPT
jgi:glyceraldehyde 3-phosphate dehydrogenase